MFEDSGYTCEICTSDLADHEPYHEYVLVHTQHFQEDGVQWNTTARVNSPRLLKMFAEVVVEHPDVPTGFEQPFTMESPFTMLFHHWDNFEERREKTKDDTERMHLTLLLDFMRQEMNSQRTEMKSMINNGAIKFSTAWTIFKPKSLLCLEEDGFLSVAKLNKTVYEESNTTGKRFEIYITRTINSGRDLCLRKEVVMLYEKELFGGGTAANIRSLPAYPLYLYGDTAALMDDLETRGRKVAALKDVKPMQYDGFAKYQKNPPNKFYNPGMEGYPPVFIGCTENGRVVVDAKTYLEDYTYEGNKLQRSWSEDFTRWAETNVGSLERMKFILCVPYVLGYSLQRKSWCRLYVESISAISWDESRQDLLKRPNRQKALVMALVKSHEYPKESPRHEQLQKGKGLVILLHGSPGTGKTLTAEVAAEVSKSPLLSISLRDLFDYSDFDENKLKVFLQYATLWKAVVLIDEADVFLEQRDSGSTTSAERNALVAVFLRYLEYFSGIAFLTSNRVEILDLAMKSRIHLALQYTAPTADDRASLWESKLLSLPAADVDLDMRKTLESLKEYNMNGREISNSVVTARTLAKHSGEKLQLKHLKDVVGIWDDFGGQLKRMSRDRRQGSFAHSSHDSAHSKREPTVKWTDPE